MDACRGNLSEQHSSVDVSNDEFASTIPSGSADSDENNNNNDNDENSGISMEKATNSQSSSLVLHRGQEALDRLEIRFRLSPHWRNDIPGLPFACGYHESVVIPSMNGTNPTIVILGGQRRFENGWSRSKSVQSMQFSRPGSWVQSSIPHMNYEREDFGAVYMDDNLYAIGGEQTGDTFEILNLNDMQAGWQLQRLPNPHSRDTSYTKAVAVGNRHIYVLSSQHSSMLNILSVYDTQTCSWKIASTPYQHRGRGYKMVSITTPTEGSYVVVLGGIHKDGSSGLQVLRSVEAYHIESQMWFRLPDLPEQNRNSSMVSSLGNRYILVAGGHDITGSTSSVIVFDWREKEWSTFPSLPEVRCAGSSVIFPGPSNKWILTGGYCRENDEDVDPTNINSIDISPGIGWAKEKLLLLCFHMRSQKIGVNAKGSCLLESLDAGVFANILLYLFVPFQDEIDAKGSIFGGIMGSNTILDKKRAPNESTLRLSSKKRKAL